jgi:hypothetical protein
LTENLPAVPGPDTSIISKMNRQKNTAHPFVMPVFQVISNNIRLIIHGRLPVTVSRSRLLNRIA